MDASIMKAITYSEFGVSAEVLKVKELPIPKVGKDEVLVALEFSGSNPSDAKSRAGNRPGITKPQFEQIVPNSDGSGIITAVGEAVDKSRIGQRVWIWNGQWQRPNGTAAEYISVPSAQAVEMPEDMSFETGACLGIPGLTASYCTLGDGALSGKTVFVSGGSGAVGHTCIQLAKWSGATVIASGSENGFEHIREAGADHVFDYRDPDLSKKILDICPSGVDRAIEVEFGENVNLLHKIVRQNGEISLYGGAKNMSPTFPFGPYLFKALKINIALIYILPKQDRDIAIKALHDAHSDGALKMAVGKVFSLEECAQSHDATLTPGRRGSVLIKI
ncbi:NADPH:quinone reductase [Paracoccaceae bacterium]|nr:NADPH:quinone reductase [Paracoccaceae bacterium]